MRVKVVKEFRDRDNFLQVHPVGEIADFEDSLADSLKARGLVEEMEPKTRRARANEN